MRLSSKVPAVLQHHVVGVTTELVQRHHLSIDDVAHWVASRDVLRRHGNCAMAFGPGLTLYAVLLRVC